MQTLLLYALQFVGRPYRWGGDDPMAGFDCSGFVQELLASMGLDPVGDQTAQGLYEFFAGKTNDKSVQLGTLLFFGKDLKSITHVAMAIDDFRMIEAGGGGSKTLTEADAEKQNAYVRVRAISNRRDLVAALRPQYQIEKEKPA